VMTESMKFLEGTRFASRIKDSCQIRSHMLELLDVRVPGVESAAKRMLSMAAVNRITVESQSKIPTEVTSIGELPDVGDG